VIGNAVNVAARVEAATRQTGDAILIAGRTRAPVRNPDVALTERPNVALRDERESIPLDSPCSVADLGGPVER